MPEYSNLSNVVVESLTGPVTNSTLTAAKTVTAAESGTAFFLSLAAGFAVTLPTPAAGLNYKFIVKTAPTGAAYTIAATGAIIHGTSVVAATGAANVAAGITTITLAANQAVVGTEVSLTCDGTLWYVTVIASIVAAVTFA